jgi:phosphate transport system permease protein
MSAAKSTREKVEAGLPRRRRKERTFKLVGLLATTVGIVFLGVFFSTLIAEGSSAFKQTFLQLDIDAAIDARCTEL